MSRVIIGIFLFSQAAGEICSWVWHDVSNWLGPWLWVASVLLLLPGDLIVETIIEKFFWGSSLTLRQLQWLKTPFEIVLNGLVWALVLYGLKRFQNRAVG